ncbi:MAG: B12-binding domain-containing radical SAM protein [Kiritimatiellales bacterium]|nr:B12-binding domain-containing radical SAM protein [Kiritimatiellales bacterium]
MMTDIVLTTFNARYAHTAFGLRCLMANLGELADHAELQEFDLSVQPRVAAEKILATNPRIVGIGCYIWNIELATKVAALIKRISPETKIVLGGPEISHETEEQEIYQYADHVICGEGEVEFSKLCKKLLYHGDTEAQSAEKEISMSPCLHGKKTLHAKPVDVAEIELPYDLYTDEDIAHRAIYVEASRGCPFRCEYCMSSLDPEVRYFPMENILRAFSDLIDRGARTFKFVDRTFNIDIPFALEILYFFRERYQPGMMLHFEMIPDRLPNELMDAVKECPVGMLQFEIGIQTFNEEVAHRVQRPLDIGKIEANMRRLREETGVHIHSDLIAGLPGESLESFESGFNRLLALNPQEIQLGILKRLRGAPIDRHSKDWKMVYSPHAPYEILQNSLIPFGEMQRLQRFARFWNLTVNNGNFISSAPLIWQDAPSPFAAFMQWSDWLYRVAGTTGNIALPRLAQFLFEFLTQEKGLDEKTGAKTIWDDYQQYNRPGRPAFAKKFGLEKIPNGGPSIPGQLPRQARHQKD